MRVFRVPLLALVAALAVGATAERAGSALFFVFRPTTAKPGQAVALRTPHTPLNFDVRREGLRPLQRPIALYLVSNSIAKDVSSPDDPRLHDIGSIVLDANGRGVLRFTVPSLPSDRYAVAAACAQCAPFSRGSTFFALSVDERNIARTWRPVMLLRVEAASPAPRAGDGETPVRLWTLAAVLGAFGIGLAAGRRPRRGSRRLVRPQVVSTRAKPTSAAVSASQDVATISVVRDPHGVATFRAEVVFRFEAESLETAGSDLRRLQQAARDAGFESMSARVEPDEPEERTGGALYAPIDPE
jgi:hypothetical protein